MACGLRCLAIRYATLYDAARISLSMQTKPKIGRVAFFIIFGSFCFKFSERCVLVFSIAMHL